MQIISLSVGAAAAFAAITAAAPISSTVTELGIPTLTSASAVQTTSLLDPTPTAVLPPWAMAPPPIKRDDSADTNTSKPVVIHEDMMPWAKREDTVKSVPVVIDTDEKPWAKREDNVESVPVIIDTAGLMWVKRDDTTDSETADPVTTHENIMPWAKRNDISDQSETEVEELVARMKAEMSNALEDLHARAVAGKPDDEFALLARYAEEAEFELQAREAFGFDFTAIDTMAKRAAAMIDELNAVVERSALMAERQEKGKNGPLFPIGSCDEGTALLAGRQEKGKHGALYPVGSCDEDAALLAEGQSADDDRPCWQKGTC